MKRNFCLLLFCCASFSPAFTQTPGSYVLTKNVASSQGSNPSVLSEEFVASNLTDISGSFFVLLSPARGFQVQTAVREGQPLHIRNSNGTLIGPFEIGANSSVTLGVSETASSAISSDGEAFTILSEAQLSSVSALSTPNSSDLVRSVRAAPNVARNDQPIDFLVELNGPAKITLMIFTLAGEEVKGTQHAGNTGTNTLVWDGQTRMGQPVASGLYLYQVEVAGDNGETWNRIGKLLVLH